jgi:Rad3-related DNA helicase
MLKTKFEMYPQQKEYMDAIINSGKHVVMLELPTGMGKTVANLVATVELEPVQIHYYCNTHQQAEQVLEEIKVLNMLNEKQITAVQRGGRGYQCLHEDILNCREELTRLRMCKGHIKQNHCRIMFSDRYLIQEILDERKVLNNNDINAIARRQRLCPRVVSKYLMDMADIVVMPTNYLFLPSPTIDEEPVLKKDIAIIDEAHALDEKVLSNTQRTITTYDLQDVNETIRGLVTTHLGRQDDEDIQDRLCHQYWSDFFERVWNLESGEIYYFDQNASLENLQDSANRLFAVLQSFMERNMGDNIALSFDKTMLFIEGVISAKNTIFYAEPVGREGKRFIIRSLDPYDQFQPAITEYNRVVITSGSLVSRIMCKLLGLDRGNIPYDVREYKDGHPLAAGVVVGSLRSENITTRYTERSDEMYDRIAKAIYNISQWSPAGTIVFCPSYSFAQRLFTKPDNLRKHGSDYNYKKPTFFVNEASDLDRYRRALDEKGKAILFSAYRGIGSEGTNFPDGESRATVLIGVPYLNPNEPIVKAQKEYYTKVYGAQIAGDWYMRETAVPIAQAFGRTYRNTKDWGLVYVLDYRAKSIQFYLPQWVGRSFATWKAIDLVQAKKVAQIYYEKVSQ